MRTFNQITEEIFKIPSGEIKDTLSAKDIPEWDSMTYLLFVAELEKEFGVVFSMDEVLSAQCIGDLRKIVEGRNQKL